MSQEECSTLDFKSNWCSPVWTGYKASWLRAVFLPVKNGKRVRKKRIKKILSRIVLKMVSSSNVIIEDLITS